MLITHSALVDILDHDEEVPSNVDTDLLARRIVSELHKRALDSKTNTGVLQLQACLQFLQHQLIDGEQQEQTNDNMIYLYIDSGNIVAQYKGNRGEPIEPNLVGFPVQSALVNLARVLHD